MGMACEQAMYAATDGVNTHKGGIFPGLICFAAGRLRGLNRLSAHNRSVRGVTSAAGWWRGSWLPARMRQRRASGSFSSLA
jgi:hypothetical protein